ncbi:hypothetical protein [Paludibacterium denitrificans]|uniref:YD repeat-containing protein n=1 Tax=Paludibacterium denitrificans TaxID=2675226 RepID=A0A844GB74_9NEIS|nr:hypothetical protein [Paludibacterium denitrificans]MTD33746.1 hypothetical protein [Paludibacterium denitrificans]
MGRLQPPELTAPGGDSTEYRYDPLGRRIAKLSQGKTTLYGWDGDVLAFETQDDAAVHYLFEPGSFIPLARCTPTPSRV